MDDSLDAACIRVHVSDAHTFDDLNIAMEAFSAVKAELGNCLV